MWFWPLTGRESTKMLPKGLKRSRISSNTKEIRNIWHIWITGIAEIRNMNRIKMSTTTTGISTNKKWEKIGNSNANLLMRPNSDSPRKLSDADSPNSPSRNVATTKWGIPSNNSCSSSSGRGRKKAGSTLNKQTSVLSATSSETNVPPSTNRNTASSWRGRWKSKSSIGSNKRNTWVRRNIATTQISSM